jgi:hypothetical protein
MSTAISPDESPLTAAIRNWLELHPFGENQELDIDDLPAGLFDEACSDNRMKQLNRQIRGLPARQQKLLFYLSRDIDPALIMESMEYTSPELFWLDKALLVKEVDPGARKQDVLQVYNIYQKLLDEIYGVADQMDLEFEKSRNRKYRNWMLIAAPVILLMVFLFVYPLMVKPEPVALFEEFIGTYRPDMQAIDTLDYQGGAYYEALMLVEEKDFDQSAELFEEMIVAESPFRAGSRWFLALINLRKGDSRSCKEQLVALRAEDPVFYKKVAEKLRRRL